MASRRLASEMILVLAMDLDGGIGLRNDLPWPPLPEDLEHLHATTSRVSRAGLRNAVVYGWKTWESIGCRPFADRFNVVLSRSTRSVPDGVGLCHSIEQALDLVSATPDIDQVYVLGGVEVYLGALAMGASTVWLTLVEGHFEADARMPPVETWVSAPDALVEDAQLSRSYTSGAVPFTIKCLRRVTANQS